MFSRLSSSEEKRMVSETKDIDDLSIKSSEEPDYKALYEKVKIQNVHLERRLSSKDQLLAEKDLTIEQMNEMTEVMKEIVRNTDLEIATAKKEIRKQEQIILDLQASKFQLRLDCERTDNQLRQAYREAAALVHESREQDGVIEKLKEVLSKNTRKNKQLSNELDDQRLENEKLVGDLNAIMIELKNTKDELALSRVRIDSSKQSIQEMDFKIQSLEQQNNKLVDDVEHFSFRLQVVEEEKINFTARLKIEKERNFYLQLEKKEVKVRDERIGGRLLKVANLIKQRLQSRKAFSMRFPFHKLVQRKESLSYLDDNVYGIVQELLAEFLYVA
ncbi:tropomyosin-1-like [Clytia hemisphaerica]|uniref:tropomyosin-1-like n=1 Tax=Clytia hemisphaerica TaxID=252671 RepID=UPI0034D617F4